MKVIVTDDKGNYIARDNNNNLTMTTDETRAVVMEEKSANNLIKNNLRNMKFFSNRNWKVKEIGMPLPVETIIPVPTRVFQDKTESELLQMVANSLEAYCELEYRAPLMQQQLYEQTKLREDLEHTIEDMKFNASEGYKLCKKMQDISRLRRTLKKNATKLQVIREENVFPSVAKVQKVLGKIKGIDEADTYRYRVTNEFGESVKFGQTSKEMGIKL